MEKKCKRCLVVKPLADFYRHKKMADGRLGFCKECVKNRVAKNRRVNIERYRKYDRQRGNRQTTEYAREYYKKNRGIIMEKQREARAGVKRLEFLARTAVKNAIRGGKLVRPEKCEACDKLGTPHGHHENYSEPLEVVWLCPKCHGAIHQIRGDLLK